MPMPVDTVMAMIIDGKSLRQIAHRFDTNNPTCKNFVQQHLGPIYLAKMMANGKIRHRQARRAFNKPYKYFSME